MNWTFTVTTNGMAGVIGAVYLGVTAIRTRRHVVEAARSLRRTRTAEQGRITLAIGRPPTRSNAHAQQRRDQARGNP